MELCPGMATAAASTAIAQRKFFRFNHALAVFSTAGAIQARRASVMRLHNRRADLQPRLAPFPIAATWAARKREYLTELFRLRGQRRLKRRREVRLGIHPMSGRAGR